MLDEFFVGVDVVIECVIILVLKFLCEDGKIVVVVYYDFVIVVEYFDDIFLINMCKVVEGLVEIIFIFDNFNKIYGGCFVMV